MKITNTLINTLAQSSNPAPQPIGSMHASQFVNCMDIAPTLHLEGFSVPSMFHRKGAPKMPDVPGWMNGPDGQIQRGPEDVADVEPDWRATAGGQEIDDTISWGHTDGGFDEWDNGIGNDEIFMVAVRFLKRLLAPLITPALEASSPMDGAALFLSYA